ncbi:ladderlectin [Austrofundulus limnaeus]|uniref:Ladderlectin n=1 Tax=Austrofundulus limnaeus TaxID=52670 RepID=A0A2I4C0D7_AUSLI|nr:PREDICTED: ladderlectin-like [Austrofundulus limnaeus]
MSTLYVQNCYLFNDTASTWDDAEAACNQLNAHLTSIQTPDQYAFLRVLIEKATGANTRTWVGGTNLQDRPITGMQNGAWTWVDGTLFTFTNWGPGEPNNAGGNEHCMDINVRGQDYVNDENCDTMNAFICVIHNP